MVTILEADGDVVAVRPYARHVAELRGFERQDLTRIATAVSALYLVPQLRHLNRAVSALFRRRESSRTPGNALGIGDVFDILDSRCRGTRRMVMPLENGTGALPRLCSRLGTSFAFCGAATALNERSNALNQSQLSLEGVP
jgi:hypothetical protein